VWGANTSGQLGDGNSGATANRLEPVPIAFDIDTLNDYTIDGYSLTDTLPAGLTVDSSSLQIKNGTATPETITLTNGEYSGTRAI
jgi:hypothetical protein